MSEENFDFFEQQSIMNGETTPAEITAKQEDDMLEEARDMDFDEEDLPERDESVWADDPEDEDEFE